MLKSTMNENKLQDGYYLICKIFNEVFYCMLDGDATLKRAEAAVFGDKQAIASKIADFAQDVFEYAGGPATVKKIMSKMRVVPCAKLSEALVNEDFGIGVGAPVGADQGIPYGGDGKAVVPCYMGCTSRHGTVNKATGFGGILWPKRKKKRLKRRYPNFVQEAYEDDYTLTAVNIAEFLEEQGVDDSVYHIEETDDNNIVITLNADPVETNYVQNVNNLFAEISIVDYNSSDVIIINIDRLTQTASIRIADEDTVSGMACANMQDFENVWNTLNNLTEQ